MFPKNVVPKNFSSQKIFFPKKMSLKYFDPKIFWSQKNKDKAIQNPANPNQTKIVQKQTFDEQNFWSKSIFGPKNFGMKKIFCSKNIFVQKHIGINDTKRFKVQKLWSKLGLVLGQGQMSSGQRFLVQMSSVIWHLSKKAQET